jgi:hypothetical protein
MATTDDVIREVVRLDLKPGEVLLVRYAGRQSRSFLARALRSLQRQFGAAGAGVRVAVTDEGVKDVTVISAVEAELEESRARIADLEDQLANGEIIGQCRNCGRDIRDHEGRNHSGGDLYRCSDCCKIIEKGGKP